MSMINFVLSLVEYEFFITSRPEYFATVDPVCVGSLSLHDHWVILHAICRLLIFFSKSF